MQKIYNIFSVALSINICPNKLEAVFYISNTLEIPNLQSVK